MTWSAQQYTRFEEDRTRPVRDLVAAIPGPGPGPVKAIDLGCGPGNSTEILQQRFPKAEITGLDSSPDMIAAARQRLPGLAFELADLATWSPSQPYAVILSNAVLHWLPNHAALMPRLAGHLADHGSLAFQMPDNTDEPAYVLMREIAASGPWAEKIRSAGGKRSEMGNAEWYYATLRPHCRRVDVWRTTYTHVLPGGAGAIVEWFKGSGLRPYLQPLDPAEQQEFLDRYTAAIAKAYTITPEGDALLPFPRLFVVATR